MYVTFEFFTVTNKNNWHFILYIYYICSDNADLIAKNEIFVSLKMHVKNMSMFFSSSFKCSENEFQMNFLGLMH